MKHFEIPGLFGEEKLNSFNSARSQVYTWIDGKFIVNVFASNFAENKYARSQVYVAGNELQTVIRDKVTTVHGDVWDFQSLVKATDKNHNFYIEGKIDGSNNYEPENFRLISIPHMNTVYIPDSVYADSKGLKGNYGDIFKPPFGGEEMLRVGKNALLAGKATKITWTWGSLDFLNVFLRDVKADKDEVVVLHFHQNNFYEPKILKVASREGGEVISLAISLDKLTACALISYPFGSWEATTFDLEQ